MSPDQPNLQSNKPSSIRPLNDQKYLNRINIFMILILIGFGVLIYRLFELQILKNEFLSNQAVNNKRQIIRIPSYRGEIYLKNKEVVAKNISTFSIYIIPENFPHYKRSKEKFNILTEQIEKKFNVSKKKVLSILKRARFNPYLPYVLKKKVSSEEIYYLAENLENFPGLIYQDTLTRSYPLGEIYSHISGYVQAISSKGLKKKKNLGYGPNSIIGKTGLESYYDLDLRGRDGYKINIVDVKNRIKEERFPKDGIPIPGKNIYLTIDPNIQKILHRTLKGMIGGAIVVKVNTGEILGLYSYPFFDPNVFTEKNNFNKLNSYLKDPNNSFLNRVIQTQYPPSSIFKLVVALAALDDPKINPYNTSNYCEGKLIIGDSVFKCTGYHGRQNFLEAIANSCNVFFYKLGIKISPQIIQEYANTYFNLGEYTGIDLSYEKKGRIPSPRWKVENRGNFWWDGDTANLSIGQGFALTTIAQLNTVTTAIANGGKVYRPNMVYQMESLKDETTFDIKPELLKQLPFSKDNIKFIQKAMRQVVKWGTAHRINNNKLLVAGKTGTAQSGVDTENHAWFTGYAPYTTSERTDIKEKQIAVTVLIEHGGFGSVYPATFSDAILQAIFLKRDPIRVIKENLQPWESQAKKYEKWLKIRNEEKLPENELPLLNNG